MKAPRDKLTGLFLREYFEDELAREVSRCNRYGRPLTVLMVSVQYDYFEYELDVRWAIGYRVFRELGEAVRRTYRDVDLTCRWDGEVVAVALPETGKEGAAIAGERLRKAVEDIRFDASDIKAGKTEVRVAVNVGVATFPEHGKNPQDLLDRALESMHEAERQGGNKVVVGPEGAPGPVDDEE